MFAYVLFCLYLVLICDGMTRATVSMSLQDLRFLWRPLARNCLLESTIVLKHLSFLTFLNKPKLITPILCIIRSNDDITLLINILAAASDSN